MKREICVISRGERRERKRDDYGVNVFAKWHCIKEQSGHTLLGDFEACDVEQFGPGQYLLSFLIRNRAASHPIKRWTRQVHLPLNAFLCCDPLWPRTGTVPQCGSTQHAHQHVRAVSLRRRRSELAPGACRLLLGRSE